MRRLEISDKPTRVTVVYSEWTDQDTFVYVGMTGKVISFINKTRFAEVLVNSRILTFHYSELKLVKDKNHENR